MFTDYRLNNELWIEQIFDGRLKCFGIHEAYVSESTPEWRCLTDGNSVLWVEGDEEIEFLLGFGMFNATEKILTAIEETFDVEIFSEHQQQYWGKEGEEECRCGRREVAEEVQAKLNILIMRYVRGESPNIGPNSSFMPVANIAKDLILENPVLASLDREEELLKKTNQICIEKYNVTHGVIEQKLKIAAHLGHVLH